MAKIKIHEIAKKIGLTSKEIIEKANELGINVKSHLSSIEDEQAEKIEKIVTQTFIIYIPYTEADIAMRFIREAKADIIQRNYDEQGTFLTIEIRKDDELALRERLSKILTLKFIGKENDE